MTRWLVPLLACADYAAFVAPAYARGFVSPVWLPLRLKLTAFQSSTKGKIVARYVETWRKHNSGGGLTCRSIGVRQTGMNYVAYVAEHPKVRGLRFTAKGELDRRFHVVRTSWRGQAALWCHSS